MFISVVPWLVLPVDVPKTLKARLFHLRGWGKQDSPETLPCQTAKGGSMPVGHEYLPVLVTAFAYETSGAREGDATLAGPCRSRERYPTIRLRPPVEVF